MTDISPFPFQSLSPALWPPSCPRATHRPASPFQTPPLGSPQTGQQSSGPHSPPGLGEDFPQYLRILSVQPLALSPSRLTSFPAVPKLQASCQPTCTQLWAHNPQEDLQRARLPLSPTLCQPAGEPAVPDGCGAPSLSQSPASLSPSPSPVPVENCSCESPRAYSSSWGQTAPDPRARYTDRSYTSAECCTFSQGRAGTQRSSASPMEPEAARGLAFKIQINSCCHGQVLWASRAIPSHHPVFR